MLLRLRIWRLLFVEGSFRFVSYALLIAFCAPHALHFSARVCPLRMISVSGFPHAGQMTYRSA